MNDMRLAAGLIAAILTWVAFNFAAAYIGLSINPDGSPTLRAIAWTCLLLGLIPAGFVFSKIVGNSLEPPPPTDREIEIADIRAKVESRFRGRIFILSDEFVNSPEMTNFRNFISEEQWEKWQRILSHFPVEPRTQDEAVANEAKFWRRMMSEFLISPVNGQQSLTKHADILKYYQDQERWILREYFAATGKVIDPYLKEYHRLHEERRNLLNDNRYLGESKKGVRTRLRSYFDKIEDQLHHLNNHDRPAHFEKWGGWFLFHIEDAFLKQQQKHTDHGPSKATTPDRGADDGTGWDPKA